MHRILHLIETGGPGGAETVLANLAAGLPNASWESRVIVPRRDWLHERLSENAVDTRVLSSKGPADVRFLLSLSGEIRGFRPDLIHAHFLGSGVYGTLASGIAGGIPLVCTFHGIPDVNREDRLLFLKGRILSRAQNRLVYVSHHLRRLFEPLLGVRSSLGEVIHNGVRFPEPEMERGGFFLPGMGPGDQLIGAVGNIRPAKDYPNLLRAARVVCSVRRNVHFAVAGEGTGTLLQEIMGLRRELGLEDRVHFLGFRPDIPSLMSGFDVFVSSSVIEGLPLASVEAMGMGKPVVLTNCGGVPEVAEDGRTGLLVPVEDPEALAGGILRLLDDPGFSAQLGSAARESVRNRFSLSSMIRAYEQLYLSLLARSRSVNA